MTTKDGFTVEWRDQVVTISKSVKEGTEFDYDLEKARGLLRFFKMGVGSEWGCDGVGYGVQKRVGLVRVNRSGVGKKSFLAGCAAISARASSKEVKA